MLSKRTIHKIIGHLQDLDAWEMQAEESGSTEISAEAKSNRRAIRATVTHLRDELGLAPSTTRDETPYEDIEELLKEYEALWYSASNDAETPHVIAIVRDWLDRTLIPF